MTLYFVPQRIYLIKWPNTWEPEENLANCDVVKKRFEDGDDTDYPENVQPFNYKDPNGTVFEIYKVLAKRKSQQGQVNE